MRPGAAVLVAVLFVASAALVPLAATAAVTVPAGQYPQVVPVENSSNYLSIPSADVQRTAITADGLDISTAVAVDAQQLRSEHRALTAERAFHAADTRSERYAPLVEFLAWAEERSDAISTRDRTAIAAFSNGSMSASAFARERARVAADARNLRGAVSRVQTVASTSGEFTLGSDLEARFENVKGELEVRQGPVSDQLLRAKTGTADRQRVYVGGAGNGYVMMVTEDGEYVRETHFADERVPNGTDRFAEGEELAVSAAISRGSELYPWVTSESLSPSSKALGTSGMYRYRADFPSGALTVYLDGNTTNAFREHHRQRIDDVPATQTLQVTNGTLRVVVNRTYETGPMHLSVYRTSSGVSTNATVALDGHEVGATGPDGSMRLVELPHPTRVNVTADDGDRVTFQIPLS